MFTTDQASKGASEIDKRFRFSIRITIVKQIETSKITKTVRRMRIFNISRRQALKRKKKTL